MRTSASGWASRGTTAAVNTLVPSAAGQAARVQTKTNWSTKAPAPNRSATTSLAQSARTSTQAAEDHSGEARSVTQGMRGRVRKGDANLIVMAITYRS